jgi:hypothetical protein
MREHEILTEGLQLNDNQNFVQGSLQGIPKSKLYEP